MAPAWLRNPLAIFGAGVLAIGLSILVLMVVDGSPEEADLLLDVDPYEDVRPAPEAMASPRRGALFGQGAVAPGVRESSYIDRVVVVTGPLGGRHTFLWLEDDQAKTQTLARPAEVPWRSLHNENSVVFYAVQRRNADGERELGVVYDAAAFGSGSPVARFALLRLEEGEWREVWDSGVDNDWRGSHGTVEFPNRDLSELVVRSDSWSDGHDELSDVLSESNPGPHRFFIDTWVREGDTYVRQDAETFATPYATFVEFLLALSRGDDFIATDQVVDGDLVAVARDLGLDSAPGQYWMSTCESGLECGKYEPIKFDPTREHGEPAVAVFFEEQSGHWLISDIQPDDD